MLYERVQDFPHPFFDAAESPFLSLCMPTHRHLKDGAQDMILFKNLLKELHEKLVANVGVKDAETLIEPLETMKDDRNVFHYTQNGLCVYAAGGRAVIYFINVSPEPLVTIGDTFHITPLIRHFGSRKDFHALTLSRSEFRLYRGNMNRFERIALPEHIKSTSKDVLGEDTTENTLVHASYGGTSRTMVHGHSDRKEEIDKDTERFFTYIDRVVTNISKQAGIPLVLVALPEHHSFFKTRSKNSQLLTNAVKKSPQGMDENALKTHVEKIMNQYHEDTIRTWIDMYENSAARGIAEQDIQTIARAVVKGRVRTLMIEADKRIQGAIDKTTGDITFGDARTSESDILDELALLVYEQSGNVIVIDKATMVTQSGVAAIFRY